MSCNGCRVLRKGCSETCVLRPCLQTIETAEAQGHATVFVAKFFGRAGLTSFISAVPENQRPAVFQSLLFEAAGRTVNPVNGAVGLLSTGNWHVCQAAVETVLKGGTLRPIQEFHGGPPSSVDGFSDCTNMFNLQDSGLNSKSRTKKRRRSQDQDGPMKLTLLNELGCGGGGDDEKPRLGSPSLNDSGEESGTTTCYLEGRFGDQNKQLGKQPKLLNLFN